MDRRPLWNGCAAALALLGLAGCPPLPPPKGGPDATPPGFLNVDVKVEPRVGSPTVPPDAISILSGDVSRTISKNDRIRVIANVGDSESGIASIALATVSGNDGQGVLKNYDLSWSCRTQGPPLVGILELGTLAPSPAIGAIDPPKSLASVDVTIDPVGQTASCGNGTAQLSGFVRLVATNGKGATSTSGTFLFEFVDPR
jgi:hypothetical protein